MLLSNQTHTHTHTHTHTPLAFVIMINGTLQILSLTILEYQRWVFAKVKQTKKKKIDIGLEIKIFLYCPLEKWREIMSFMQENDFQSITLHYQTYTLKSKSNATFWFLIF